MGRPYTVASLADHWGTSDTFIYDQIKAGRLQAFKLGGKLIRIKPEAVEEYECQGIHGRSASLPANEQTEHDTGASASNGLMPEDRTASRLARLIDRPRRPRLATSGPGAH